VAIVDAPGEKAAMEAKKSSEAIALETLAAVKMEDAIGWSNDIQQEAVSN
jgi:hypothetical protein